MQTPQQNHQSASLRQASLVLFISDLHLCESRPHITEAFLQFLKVEAIKADALYVLGDLFEYWAGDDDIHDAFHQTIVNAFLNLSTHGVTLYLMHGNRDFLMGDAFCRATKMILLPDPSLVNIHQQSVLLSHGDALCTDDKAYQAMRIQFRNTDWQEKFLSQPLQNRKAQIANIRMQSEEAKAQKTVSIMDVNPDAVASLLKKFEYPPLFIHGHTHRPARHEVRVDGYAITRWVLGDWYEQGSYLALDANGCRAVSLKN